jgi:predicted nucleic acid-binding protein
MRGLLLDTTVLIDVGRGYAPTVAWLERQPLARLHVSSITVGELFRGAYRSFASSPAALTRELHKLRTRLLPRFAGRLLSFDADAAEIWGRLVGMGEAQGRRPPPDDARIAAIALAHDLTVATSNARDLAPLCTTVDPRAG